MLRYKSTDEDSVRPNRLMFTLISAEEIKRMSVCRVTDTTLYYRGLPASGGLLDPLMGTVDRRHLCATCRNDPQRCPGHTGHIELSWPVYHLGYMDLILKTLRTVCYCCSRVCANDEAPQVDMHACTRKAHFTMMHSTLRPVRVCPHCGMPQPTFSRVQLGIKVEWPVDIQWESEEEREFCTRPFTARETLSILKHIPSEDLKRLGFNPESHPKDMIIQNMVVPPPSSRPAIYSSEGSRSRGQNDLTIHLVEILKRSNDLESVLDEPWKTATFTEDVSERLNRLQYEVFMIINNTTRIQKPQGMGRNSSNTRGKSLQCRLKGKEGRVRGNLMGKRVDFCARCVITPDAFFDCDRVGVPYSIAKRLTKPERVNASNVVALSKRVALGASDVRGAQTVIQQSGVVIDLSKCKNRSSVVLRSGDVVERFLQDDDVVVFNRQPSLHMHSMQAHRVRLMPGNTFRISLNVASPYNADFDGDEMNLHVPQSPCAATECAVLMGVAQNCIGSQSNKPVMGIVQDSLLGLHVLSASTTFLDHAHACRIMSMFRHAPKVLPVADICVNDGEKRYWTGKTLFSCLLPRTMCMGIDSKFSTTDEAELPVVIYNGKCLTGLLRKAHVGTGAGGIVDRLCRDFGGVAAMRFMADAQRMTHEFLLQHGQSVGIHDVMLSREGHERVMERIEKATLLCEEIQKEMEGNSSSDMLQRGEAAIMKLLSKTLLQTGSIVNEHMSTINAIRLMVTAGSKGSFINLSQICASLGQQSLEGSRISSIRGARTLPCFAVDDVRLASRGMVTNSFALGLTPPELFFHAVGGREGLVDTAVKTSQTGYLQRRMNKSMEDNCIMQDGTVRNSSGNVIAFQWGTDGMHPVHLERVKMDVLLQTEDVKRHRFTEFELQHVFSLTRDILVAKQNILLQEHAIDARVLLPFDVRHVKAIWARNKHTQSRPYVDLRRARERLVQFLAKPGVCKATRLAVVDAFCESEVDGVGEECYESGWTVVMSRIARAAVQGGESVGCIAAQSVGEPATQLTLNTFHSAGCATKNVTLGIPRLIELLDASKTPKTPCTTIRFLYPFSKCKDLAEYFASTLALTRLEDVVNHCEIIDEELMNDEWIRQICPSREGTRYVKLHLAKDIMKSRHLTPGIIQRLVAAKLGARGNVMCSEVNSVDWFLIIQYMDVDFLSKYNDSDTNLEVIMYHRATKYLLDTTVVGGQTSVTGAISGEFADEHVVHAYGNCLNMCSHIPCVDWSRCTSNDVFETLNLYGIEACAHVLFDQIQCVVSFDGTYVDPRHILLIVDNICRSGQLMPLNRHGINRTDSSPLMRCSFEETMDVLCDAAAFSQHENAKGVSASIMLGQTTSVGTGACEVLFAKENHAHPRMAPVYPSVLRSTCRSFVKNMDVEIVEYIFDDQRSSGNPRRVNHEFSESRRVRARFRPVSPT